MKMIFARGSSANGKALPGCASVGAGALVCLAALGATAGAHAAPGVSFSATRLEFGNELYGQHSPPQALKITNSGTTPLSIHSLSFTGADPEDFLIGSDSGEATLAPGASRTVGIQFHPHLPPDPADRTAVLAVSDNASGSPQLISLAGKGVSTFVNRSPRQMQFTATVPGSAEQTLTIRNDWNYTLHIDTTRTGPVGAGAGDFYWKPAPGFTPNVAPGASTDVLVGFRPRAPGTRAASLAIYDDAPFSPHMVTLEGRYTALPARFPAISFDKNPLDFHTQPVNGPGSSLDLTITNTGNGPLYIWGNSVYSVISGEFTKVADTGESPIQPGGSRRMTIQFRPVAPGPRTGYLNLSDNAPGSDSSGYQQVLLTGIGVGAGATSDAIQISPGRLDFGNQLVPGDDDARLVVLTNRSNQPVGVLTPSFTGPNASDFIITADYFPGRSLQPGASRKLYIAFHPRGLGSRSASLLLVDPEGHNYLVPLSGMGVSTFLNLSPGSVEFGKVRVGSMSTQSIVVRNDGYRPLYFNPSDQIQVSGPNAGDFSYDWQPCFSAALGLAPGQSCTIPVTFKPSGAGLRKAILLIHDYGENAPHAVPLSGTGGG